MQGQRKVRVESRESAPLAQIISQIDAILCQASDCGSARSRGTSRLRPVAPQIVVPLRADAARPFPREQRSVLVVVRRAPFRDLAIVVDGRLPAADNPAAPLPPRHAP